jgi:hypothetical protein
VPGVGAADDNAVHARRVSRKAQRQRLPVVSGDARLGAQLGESAPVLGVHRVRRRPVRAPGLAGERPLRDRAEAAGARLRQDGQRLLVAQVHGGLHAAERAAHHGVAQRRGVARVGGDAQLARCGAILERACHLAFVQQLEPARVQVHDVDQIGAQPLARRVHAGDHAVVGPVGVAVHAVADLGGQHEFVAAAREVPADALLRQAVGAGRVDQVEAEVERVVQQSRRHVVGQTRIARLHGAEAEHGHVGAAAAIRAALHGPLSARAAGTPRRAAAARSAAGTAGRAWGARRR